MLSSDDEGSEVAARVHDIEEIITNFDPIQMSFMAIIQLHLQKHLKRLHIELGKSKGSLNGAKKMKFHFALVIDVKHRNSVPHYTDPNIILTNRQKDQWDCEPQKNARIMDIHSLQSSWEDSVPKDSMLPTQVQATNLSCSCNVCLDNMSLRTSRSTYKICPFAPLTKPRLIEVRQIIPKVTVNKLSPLDFLQGHEIHRNDSPVVVVTLSKDKNKFLYGIMTRTPSQVMHAKSNMKNPGIEGVAYSVEKFDLIVTVNWLKKDDIVGEPCYSVIANQQGPDGSLVPLVCPAIPKNYKEETLNRSNYFTTEVYDDFSASSDSSAKYFIKQQKGVEFHKDLSKSRIDAQLKVYNNAKRSGKEKLGAEDDADDIGVGNDADGDMDSHNSNDDDDDNVANSDFEGEEDDDSGDEDSNNKVRNNMLYASDDIGDYIYFDVPPGVAGGEIVEVIGINLVVHKVKIPIDSLEGSKIRFKKENEVPNGNKIDPKMFKVSELKSELKRRGLGTSMGF